MTTAFFGHLRPKPDALLSLKAHDISPLKIAGSFCDPYSFPLPSSLSLEDPTSFVAVNVLDPFASHKGVLFQDEPLFYVSHPCGLRVSLGSLPFLNERLSKVSSIKGPKEVLAPLFEAYGITYKDGAYLATKELPSKLDASEHSSEAQARLVRKSFPSLFKESALEEFTSSASSASLASSASKNYNLVDSFKDMFLAYPKETAESLSRNVPVSQDKILLSITSCKRLDLFQKTVNSFLNCCKDIKLVAHFLCVDDNSSPGDRKEMESLYPFFNFIWKDEKTKGHVTSMNLIRSYALSKDFKYLLHMEDDWQFFHPRNYISESLSILKENEKYGQCLFNLNYYEVLPHQRALIVGGVPKKTKDGLPFVEHEFCPDRSQAAAAFNARHGGQANCAYWPHFSFRPSLLRVSALKEVGPFYQTGHFEMAYAYDYVSKGYKSVFFDSITSLHIGKKTWEKGLNSYSLNQVEQFSSNLKDLDIVILSDPGSPAWSSFKESMVGYLPYYRKVEVGGVSLQDEDRILFAGNAFGYDQHVVAYIKAFISLLHNNKSNYLLILHDGNKLEESKWAEVDGLVKSCSYAASLDGGAKLNPFACLLRQDACENLINHLAKGVKDLSFLSSFKGTIDQTKAFSKTYQLAVRHEELKGFQFYGFLDHFGDDITCVGQNKSVQEMARLCREQKGVAFNTLGYIKHKAGKEAELSILSNPAHGIYVVNH